MSVSQLITGIIMVIIGLILNSLPLVFSSKFSFVSWIYGIPLLILGVVILFNNKEDKIEEIKSGGKK